MYSYDKFIRPLLPTDTSIHIYNDNGSIVDIIPASSILNIILSNNILRINNSKDRCQNG